MDTESGTAPDPYGTAELRRRVLDAWSAAPARFREDANAEEDYALGGYRDRVIVELAQNAADAAVRAGEPGHLRLHFDGHTLRAANTGTPLTAEGVEALSTLRASAKREETESTGRFGVGFAAVAAVSDEPVIASAGGAVAWSRRRARAVAEELPALAGELAHRGGHVPLLRLPFPASTTASPGFATEVVLPLRDADAIALVRRLLAEVGPALLLALPALHTVEIDAEGTTHTLTATHHPSPGRAGGGPAHGVGEGVATSPSPELAAGGVGAGVTIDDGGVVSRWRILEASGMAPAELLADRPVEERSRPGWSVRWAFPVDAEGAPVPLPGGVPPVLHAPTPSDEPLGLPALLIASLPLAPDRRHVAPGPLTDLLLRHAGETYANALPEVPPAPSLLDLVPNRAAAGELDARLRRTILATLAETPFLPAVQDEQRLRPREAVAVEGGAELVTVLGDVLNGLLPAAFPVRHPALATLGVRRLAPADLVDLLADLDREPAWWRGLYAALDPGAADALGALPVPLADGRTVRGPRGLLLPEEGLHPDRLEPLGLRIVHPDAVHPLLARLGAVPGTPSGVLDDALTRAAVEHSYDAEDPEPIAEAVLDLVAAAGSAPGDRPWLADLALRDADGEPYPAGELVFPDSPIAAVLEADSPFGEVDPALVERFGTEALEATGVLRTFALVRADDVTEPDFQLDDEDAWWEWVLDRLPDTGLPPVLPEFTAVRDLELVDPDRWPQALDLLAHPPLRGALDPARVLLGDGRRVEVPSYTAWWLGEHALIAGSPPSGLRTADADPLLHGLYDPAPDDLDPRLATALGVRTGLDRLLDDPSGLDDLVARLADPKRPVTADQLHSLWTALAAADPDGVTPPDRVRALDDGEPAVVDAADAIVADAPDLVPLLGGSPLLPVPAGVAERLAEVLGLALARDEVPGEVTSTGERRPVPEVVRRLLPEAPDTYLAHDELLVDGVAVPWRYAGGEVHASGTWGLARGLAWAAGRWPDRHLLAAALHEPDRAPDLLLERLF